MFLKRLDITGFKSFPDRIRLDFQPGLTAVVGPNGSGKSNIADAVRWVMGEQSVKSLRGAKMEDVIFSGTEHRRPLGYAEVVMTIDNSGRMLPLDFNEVTVTRRVYRSGESEFLINGAVCRLKDIQLLFMDTGVGREGYSIIGQGRIDEILSARSEDRRMLFEEAAGIVKFKTRRNEALHKLERERQNLIRVNDIITELETQMEPLQAQAEAAKTYLALREQYKIAHINIFLEDAERIRTDVEKCEALLSDIRAQSQSGRDRVAEARSASDSLKTSAASADTRHKQASERLLDIATSIEKKESEIQLLETKLQHDHSNHKRLEDELGKRDGLLTQNGLDTVEAETGRVENEQALTVLNHRLDERQEEYKLLDEAMRAREQALDKYNQAVMEQITVSGELKAKLRETENTYTRLEEDKERINSEIQHNETLLEEETITHKAAAEALRDNERDTENQRAGITAYEEARALLAGERSKLLEEERAARSALQECASRHKALSQLEMHHEGYYRSVRAILKMKAADARFSGICGAVGELIGVPRTYETAIEIALGGAAQHIVTRTETDAKLAVETLKATREGRATFLPLSAVSGRVLDASRLGLDKEHGYVGVASSLITYDAEYTPVISYLLGGVVVMERLNDALAAHKKYNYKQKIVTLDGELFSPGGAITGGSTVKSGIIGRGRQVKELAERLKVLEAAADTAIKALLAQEEKLAATDDALYRARERLNALLLTQNNLQNQREQSARRLEALRQTAQACAAENDVLMAKLVETNANLRTARKALQEQEENITRTRAQMDEYQGRMADERGLKEEQVQVLTDLRVEIGRRMENVSLSAAECARLAREKENLTAEMAAIRREMAVSEEDAASRQQGITEAHVALGYLKERLTEQKNEISAIESEKAALDNAIGQAEADERGQMDENTRLDKETARLEMRAEQLETDSRRLYDEIWDAYGLTYQTALPYKRTDVSGTFLRREERRLRAELAPFTDVNVGAVDAFAQLKTRHAFLVTQRDDINRAEDDLRHIIAGLTKEMEQRFAEQFEQISKHFSDVFREMFGGGKASLSLMDESNILESGIEITAQPPGKSLQTLMLLSGGERALTAIALLFAILRMKPSPFCLLDEIEAALDDANVARFASFVGQYARETQFIVITHRKGTMEAADTLYGVTMQEKGISKLVSVRFVDDDQDEGA